MPQLPQVGWLAANLDFALIMVKVVIVFGVLIFVHEFGHFFAAKLNGVKVEKFSLGFGPKLIGWTRGETEYRISAIPLGGYCKMAGEVPGEVSEEPEREFTSKTVGQRASIIVAGPMMNFLTAFPIAIVVFLIGVNEPTARVGMVVPSGTAFQAGLKEGDRIVRVDDRAVETFNEVTVALNYYHIGQPHKVVIERPSDGGHEILTHTISTRLDDEDGQRRIGVGPYFSDTTVGHVGTYSAARKAGIRAGDRIIAVDGEAVETWDEFMSLLSARAGEPVELTIERGDPSERYVTEFLAPYRTVELVGFELGSEPIVRHVQGGSPADRAGIRPFSRIERIDGEAVDTWKDLAASLRAKKDTGFTLELLHEGQRHNVKVPPVSESGWRTVIGIAPPEDVPLIVRKFSPQSKAPAAGMQVGDSILEANAEPVEDVSQFRAALEQKDGEAALLVKTSTGETRSLTVPLTDRKELKDQIGLRPQVDTIHMRYPLGLAIRKGVAKTLDYTLLTARSLWVLATGRASGKQLSGPGGILTMAYIQAREGVGELLNLFVIISVGLAFLNLMPIPVLDGGHLVFLAIEKVKGRRLSDRTLEIAQYVGLCLLLLLVIYASSNDVQRFLLPMFR